ncbi:MAG TPA: SpoIIE family protein phosphatase [Victivallales bacterium]|nr:SpoIIE family protein phosphatase [Victivallales bacterium]
MSNKKRIKIKLTVLLLSGLSAVLILLSIALTVESRKEIKNLGDFAVKIDKENSQLIASDLFLEITKQTANKFSLGFRMTSRVIYIFAYSVLNQLLKNQPDINFNNKINLTKYKNRDFFVNESIQSCTMYYWGNKNKVPQKIINNFNALLNILPTIKNVANLNSAFCKSVWVIGVDRFTFTYPKIDSYYQNAMNSAELNKDLEDSALPLKSKYPEMVHIPHFIDSPWKDISGDIVMTVETAVYGKNNKLLAWVGMDLYFKKILDSLLNNNFFANKLQTEKVQHTYMKGFLFLITKNENLIAFPDKYKKIFSLPKSHVHSQKNSTKEIIKLNNSKNIQVKELANYIKKYNTGVKKIILNGNTFIVAFSIIEVTGWTLCYVVNSNSLLHSAIKTQKKVIITESKLTRNFIWIAFIFLIVSFLSLSIFFRHYLIKPIKSIGKGIKKMEHGNFDIDLKEEGVYEIAELSGKFNYLGKELRDYMKHLKQETAARQAIETEIQIAERIQRSVLPSISDFSSNKYFELGARLDAAKNISGDFYDFFFINENVLAILIADVSGKGVPAAFFMAMSKVLIKNYCLAEPESTPAEVLEKVNKVLCLDNKSQMFATCALYYYEIKSDKLIYANAGHTACLIISEKEVHIEKDFNNIALGVLEQAKYKTGTIENLFAGSMVILYTDGLTEAVSPQDEEYGVQRLVKLLDKNKKMNPEFLCNIIAEDVMKFESNNRFDDITVLILKRK